MFGRSVSLFSVSGIEIKIDWSWVIIAVLIAWSLAQGYFPSISEGLPQATYWGMGIVALVGLFASIVLHELGHSLVAQRYGLPIRGITLFVFGGVAEMTEEPARPKVEIVMAIAGPIVSLVLAAAFSAAAAVADSLGVAAPAVVVLGYLGSLNLLLALFNLVPAFPLDGGRVLRGVLWWSTGDFRRATRWASIGGMVFSGVLIAVGLASIFSGDFAGGIWWVLIGLFLNGAAQSSRQDVELRAALKGLTVRRLMTGGPITVPPDLGVDALVAHFMYRHHHRLFPVVDGGRLVGAVSTLDVGRLPRERWSAETVAAIMQPTTPQNTVAADADVVAALATMQTQKVGRLMVVDGGRLVGVLALSDVMRLLAIQLDLARAT